MGSLDRGVPGPSPRLASLAQSRTSCGLSNVTRVDIGTVEEAGVDIVTIMNTTATARPAPRKTHHNKSTRIQWRHNIASGSAALVEFFNLTSIHFSYFWNII